MQLRGEHFPRIAHWSLIEDALESVEDADARVVFTVMEHPEQAAVREVLLLTTDITAQIWWNCDKDDRSTRSEGCFLVRGSGH